MDEQIRTQIEELVKQAGSHQAANNLQGALQNYREAAGLAGEINWAEKQIECLYNAGLVLQDLAKGQNKQLQEQAIEHFQQALELASNRGEQDSVGVLLLTLGFACTNLEKDEEAVDYLKAAASLTLDKVDFETAYSCLTTLGVLLSNSNRAEEAIPYYQRALSLAQAEPDQKEAVADTMGSLGIAYEKAGNRVEAIKTLEAYQQILFEVGDLKVKEVSQLIKRLKSKSR